MQESNSVYKYKTLQNQCFAFLVFGFVSLASSNAFASLGASVTLVGGQPGTINPSGTTELQITLSNSNPSSAITSVDFSNTLPGTLPNGLKINGAATYTCSDPSTSPATVTSGLGTFTAVNGTQTISLGGVGGTIPAHANSTDGTCTIVIPVTSGAGTSTGGSATFTYNIANGAVTGNDGGAVANSGLVSQSINVNAFAEPIINSKINSSSFAQVVLFGASATLSITISNPNVVALPNFSIADHFPMLGGQSTIKVAATPAATSTCTGSGSAATFTPSAGDTSLSASGGTIAANGSCTITVAIEGKQTNGTYETGYQETVISPTSDFSNDYGVSGTITDSNDPPYVDVISPLAVSKSFGSSEMASGQTETLSIVLSNSSSSTLTINSFTDSPIDGLGGGRTYDGGGNLTSGGLQITGSPSVSCSGTGVAGTAGTTANKLGITQTGNTTIAAGGNCTFSATFVGTVESSNTPVTYNNSIAEGAIGTTTAGVVSESASSNILVSDTLRILKSIAVPSQNGEFSNEDSYAPGNPVQYTVTVQNWSNADISNAVVTDTLSQSQTYLTGTIGGINYTPSLSGTSCVGLTASSSTGSAAPVFTIGTVPQRTSTTSPGSCQVTFWTMVSKTAVNSSSVSDSLPSGTVCSGPTCNGVGADSGGVDVDTAVLLVEKSVNPSELGDRINPNYPSPYIAENTATPVRITLRNASAQPMTGVSFTDNLPLANAGGGQLRLATPSNAATTCGGTITAVDGTTSISLSGATIPARSSTGTTTLGNCYIQFNVIGPAGTYVNSATSTATQTYADGTTNSISSVSSNNATLVYNSVLSATKNFSPTSVSSGGMSTVTVRIANSGTPALTNVSVIDPLPTGMVLANPVNAYTTCAGSSSFSGAAGASSITMSGATVAGSGSCDMIFNVVATGGSNWVNTIPAGNITADGNVTTQSAVVGTLLYSAPTNLTVSSATSPSTITSPGQLSQLTITINNGNTNVTHLNLPDYFTSDGTSGASANGMRIAPTTGATTTCTSGTVSAVAGGTSFALTGASLLANASCTITVNVTSTSVGGITNFIPVDSISTDQGLTNSGLSQTSLDTQSNVGVTKQFSPTVIKPGQRSRLTITFYNAEASPISSLAMTDTLPAGMTIPVGPNFATTCSGATVSSPASNEIEIANGNILAASGGVAATCTLSTDVTASSQGTYVNTIPISGVTGTAGGAPAANTQAATASLYVFSPIVVHKAINNKTLDAMSPAGFTTGTDSEISGASTTLTISLNNPNATDLTKAAFTDSLPSGLVVAQTPSASTTCTGGTVTAPASATSISLSGATLSANSSCTVTVQVLSNISATYTNTIAPSSITTFEGVTNEFGTSAEVIIATPPSVSKQFSPPVIAAGGISTVTIFLNNTNSSAATLSADLVDTLPVAPGNVLVAGTPDIVKTCPGSVTANAASGSITYASGSLIPAGGCSISVNVTTASSGTYINSIAAGALQTNVGNNQAPANATLTVNTLGYITGKVFDDNNVTPNGTFESGTDTPISGVSIELHSGATCSGSLLLTQSTDSAGNYIFSSLSAGTYSICEPGQPSGTTNGTTTAGGIISDNGSTGTAGTASNPSSTTSQIIGIILNNNGGSGEISGTTSNNFAEVIPSTISGTVFLDQNDNGTEDGSDSGIAGVSIELLNSVNAVISTQSTDSNGNYSFANLAPGTYSIEETAQPSGTNNGITTAGVVSNGGTAGTATGTTTVPSKISSIILPPNTTTTGNDFAEISNSRTLSGTVFLDYNNDGLENNSDYGISGITVTLTGTDVSSNAVNATTTTASDGTYSFSDLPPGTYTIVESGQPAQVTNGITTPGSAGGSASNPSASTSQIASINLTGSTTISAGNNFAKIPGAAPDLTITKTHSPASFGTGSNTGYFTITPGNIGSVASSGTVTIVDTLPTGMTVAAVATGIDWNCTGAVGASSVTCTTNDVVGANATGNVITLRVAVATGLAGQILVNTATISGGSEPAVFSGNDTATDSVAISATANVSGTVWRDINHNGILDAGEQGVSGWTVQLLLNSMVIDTATTIANGTYSFTNVSPGSGYQIRFLDPSGLVYGKAVTNEQGITTDNGVRDSGSTTVNSGTNTGNPGGASVSSGDGTLENLTLIAGDNIVQQSLPLDPSGIIYDSITRNPVSGAQITISGPGGFNPVTELVGGTATETTGSDGLYQFLLLPGAPSGTYTLAITTYPAGYVPLTSAIIPVCSNTITVASSPDPAQIQTSNTAPVTGTTIQNAGSCPSTTASFPSANQATTEYYYTFIINPSTSANIVNNHIPIDPLRFGVLTITKTTPLVDVNIGQLVPYTITVHNTSSAIFPGIDIVDTLPPGFKYKSGTGTLNGVRLEPTLSGRTMTWKNQTVAGSGTLIFKMLLVVGSGVQPGNYINSAQVLSDFNQEALTNTASATVRVVPDPLFDCSEVIGKVFDDKNANGYQDQNEPGIPNVRMATVDGLLVTSDSLGRFHIACAAVPDPDHGSHFVMKLDERTLPSGYRVTTENPRDVLLTRGKMSKINFGASIERVMRIDMTDDAFEQNSTQLKKQWANQIGSLTEQLKSSPSVLRISYTVTNEDIALGRKRLHEIANNFRKSWGNKDHYHDLVIEEELVALPASKGSGH